MKRVSPRRLCVGALCVAGSFATTLSFAAENLPEGFRKCSTYEDRDARLDCFDAQVARWSDPSPASNATAEQSFGVTGSALAQQQAKQSTQPSEITARVTAIATQPRGELVLTLENGQIWRQTQSGSKFNVRVADPVTIKAGALNSYLMVAVSGRTTKVTRIK